MLLVRFTPDCLACFLRFFSSSHSQQAVDAFCRLDVSLTFSSHQTHERDFSCSPPPCPDMTCVVVKVLKDIISPVFVVVLVAYKLTHLMKSEMTSQGNHRIVTNISFYDGSFE